MCKTIEKTTRYNFMEHVYASYLSLHNLNKNAMHRPAYLSVPLPFLSMHSVHLFCYIVKFLLQTGTMLSFLYINTPRSNCPYDELICS